MASRRLLDLFSRPRAKHRRVRSPDLVGRRVGVSKHEVRWTCKKTPNSKLQHPEKLQPPSLKSSGRCLFPPGVQCGGSWKLVLGASLDVGCWSLELSLASH